MKILYILPSFNMYGGTPKKTRDLLGWFKEKACVYSYSKDYIEHISEFSECGSNVYFAEHEGSILSDIRKVVDIIDSEGVDVIHTQFFRGEFIGFAAKFLRPRVKLLVAFVGAFNPVGVKKLLSGLFYRYVDAFVFISEYVKREKVKAFRGLERKRLYTIYNGTKVRRNIGSLPISMDGYVVLDVAGLVHHKNISVLVDAMDILVNVRGLKAIKLMVAGDGPERAALQDKIDGYDLRQNVYLLGYQRNIGGLLDECNAFVHPSSSEGFGIAVIEAMMAKKPVVVSRAGALPEIVEDHFTGLVVSPFDPEEWADAIERLYRESELSIYLSRNAFDVASERFSAERFVKNYERVYLDMIGNNCCDKA